MPTSAQPGDPLFEDEADTRNELARVLAICDGCRRCIDLCGVFPSLIERLDSVAGRDAQMMTPAMQDEVMDHCLHCGLCAIGCPYGPGGEQDQAVDLPRLAVRAQAIRRTGGHLPVGRRWTDRVLGATDRRGALAVRMSGPVNRVLGAPPGSTLRRVMRSVTGLSATRLMPPVAAERFTTWWRRVGRANSSPEVMVLPTCAVEYHEPTIGRDLLAVLDHNSVEAGVSAAVCCGAPWLHSGDLQRFASQARRVVKELGAAVDSGATVLVPQPLCAQVIRREYPHHLSDPEVRALAEAVRDPLEYLDARGILTEFPGEIPAGIAYHAACPQRVTGVDAVEARVLGVLGVPVRVVARCSGTDGLWGLRAGNEQHALAMAGDLVEELCAHTPGSNPDGGHCGSQPEVVCGGCHLANLAVMEAGGTTPQHPISVLARAYGV